MLTSQLPPFDMKTACENEREPIIGKKHSTCFIYSFIDNDSPCDRINRYKARAVRVRVLAISFRRFSPPGFRQLLLSKMHFLVTGASGLVGGNTVKYILSLNEGHTVLATDIVPQPQGTPDLSPGSSFRQADLSSIQDVDALFDASDKPIEAVIHMGAVPNPINVDYRVCHNTNVTASYNMMYTAASRGITKIVQASSVNATGLCYSDDKRRAQRFREQEFGIPLTEKDTPHFPEDAYSEFGSMQRVDRCEANVKSRAFHRFVQVVSDIRKEMAGTNS
jgi:hypothetical protein